MTNEAKAVHGIVFLMRESTDYVIKTLRKEVHKLRLAVDRLPVDEPQGGILADD